MIAAFALVGAFAALILIPLVPAIAEWRLRRDVSPLPVEREHDGNIRYFAIALRESLTDDFGDPLATTLRAATQREDYLHPSGYRVVGQRGVPEFFGDDQRLRRCNHKLVASAALILPDRFAFRAEVYGAQSIVGGNACVYRAILAESDLELAASSAVLQWAHGARVRVDRRCRLLGRLSADEFMRIEAPCRFARLHAPRIEFGEPADRLEVGVHPLQPLLDAAGQHAPKLGRTLIETDAEVRDYGLFEGPLVAYGRVTIGTRALVTGSVKGHGDIVVGEESVVDGALVSIRDVTLARGCRVRGPIVAEGAISLGTGCVIGSEANPTSLTAPRIVVAPGAIVFGTVWAREEGELQGELRADRRIATQDAPQAPSTTEPPTERDSAHDDVESPALKKPPYPTGGPGERRLAVAGRVPRTERRGAGKAISGLPGDASKIDRKVDSRVDSNVGHGTGPGA